MPRATWDVKPGVHDMEARTASNEDQTGGTTFVCSSSQETATTRRRHSRHQVADPTQRIPPSIRWLWQVCKRRGRRRWRRPQHRRTARPASEETEKHHTTRHQEIQQRRTREDSRTQHQHQETGPCCSFHNQDAQAQIQRLPQPSKNQAYWTSFPIWIRRLVLLCWSHLIWRTPPKSTYQRRTEVHRTLQQDRWTQGMLVHPPQMSTVPTAWED